MTKEIIQKSKVNPQEVLNKIQTIDELKTYVFSNIKAYGKSIKANVNVNSLINNNIPDELQNYGLTTKLYWIFNELKEFPSCCNPNCPHDGKVKQEVKNIFNGFPKYCCVKCQSIATRSKAEETSIRLYGVKNYSSTKECRERVKQACFEHYGVEHPSQAEEIKEQKVKTSIKNWGVSNYAQSIEYHKTAHKRYTNSKYPYLTFDSKWEFKVYDFLIENKISFEYQPSISIPYEYDRKHHTYHPDFLINGKIYEVKGDHFFKVDVTGKEVMINPYREPEWSDERYDYECAKYEAKHQCMLNNGVVILRRRDIKSITASFFE